MCWAEVQISFVFPPTEQDEESAVSTSEALSCGDTGDLPSTCGHQNVGQAITIGMETGKLTPEPSP